MKLRVFAGLAFGLSAPLIAQNEPPKLSFPVDCSLGESCWIARYVDRAPGPDRADYNCKSQTQDKHNGIDIVLADTSVMAVGVAVQAAAAGRVIALRNGMPDIVATKERAKLIQKQGCGNVLIIGHGNGWQTRYCHLKNDSLVVKKGDRVDAGQVIAQVGLSGLTEFPHLHFMVQRNKKDQKIQYFDPFDGGQYGDGACTQNNEKALAGFWGDLHAYQPAAVLPPVLSGARRSRSTMWDPQPMTLPTSSPALIIQARGFHAQKDDEWRFSLESPNGQTRQLKTIIQARDRQRVQAFSGIKQPKGGFMPGVWRATVELVRNGITLGKRSTSLVLQ